MPRVLRSTLSTLVVILLATAAGAAPARASRAAASAITPNMSGGGYLVVGAVEQDGTPWLEFRVGSTGTIPNAGNGFLATSGVTDHKYFRISPAEVAELADGFDAWIAAPHSTNLVGLDDGPMSLTFTGNAWNPELEPVVVVQLTCWIPTDRGSVHGGEYVALTFGQIKTIAQVLRRWLEEPNLPAAPLYSETFQ